MLLKGIEEEIYAGTPAGDIVGLSPRVAAVAAGFATEPDQRNIEFTTEPFADYDQLCRAVLERRRTLVECLDSLGGYMTIPGATMSLGDSTRFLNSNPENPYYRYIEQTYGTDVVTTSAHLNIGIDDPEKLLQACRLIRVEACLFLALTASSPFLDNRVTGFHSTRWRIFPRTPLEVPLFADQQHYVSWVQGQLASGVMQNRRHLWCSVRPNGPDAPQRLDRLELRVCDRIECPDLLLAVVALLEARVIQALENPKLDPLHPCSTIDGMAADQLTALASANEAAVARDSLEATVRHWCSGKAVPVRRWLETYLDDVRPVAAAHGFAARLRPLDRVLREGNPAQQWLAQHRAGESIREIIRRGIMEMPGFQREADCASC